MHAMYILCLCLLFELVHLVMARTCSNMLFRSCVNDISRAYNKCQLIFHMLSDTAEQLKIVD